MSQVVPPDVLPIYQSLPLPSLFYFSPCFSLSLFVLLSLSLFLSLSLSLCFSGSLSGGLTLHHGLCILVLGSFDIIHASCTLDGMQYYLFHVFALLVLYPTRSFESLVINLPLV